MNATSTDELIRAGQESRRETKILWITFIMLLLIFVILLMPMLYIGRYDVQCSDDYVFGAAAHVAYKHTGSVIKALSAVMAQIKEYYYTWQGTFTAIFLFSFYPAVFDEALYFLTPFILIGMLTLGNVMFCMTFFPKLFGMRKLSAGIVSVVLMIILTQFITTPVQGFYWYNGGVYYTFSHGLLLAALALIISDCVEHKTALTVTAFVLLAIIGGSNYVTALMGFVILSCIILGMLLWGKGRPRRMIILWAVLTVCFVISAAAPGNAVRAAEFTDTPGVIETVILAFGSLRHLVRETASLPMYGIIVAMIPLLWLEAKRSDFGFRLPVLVTALSVCILACMYCPARYAMNDEGPGRMHNIYFYTYVLTVIINIYYWCGWISKRTDAEKRSSALTNIGIIAVGLLCVVLGTSSYTDYTSGEAYRSLVSGEAWSYHACAQERLKDLRDDSKKDVVLIPYWAWSELLNFEEITEDDPNDWRNRAVAKYYEKDSVLVAPYSSVE